MIDHAFTLGGIRLHVAAIVALVGVVAWIAGVAMRTRTSRLTGAGVLALAWMFAFGGALTTTKKVAAASVVSGSSGSCASIRAGMSAKEVTAAAGKPDEVRNDEETRGPGAATWIYKGSRCAIHIIDDKVEAIE